MAFKVICRQAGVPEVLHEYPSAASTQYTEGDALKLVNGQLTQIAVGDKPLYIYKAMPPLRTLLRPGTADLSTTACETVEAIPCDGSPVEYETNLDVNAIPQINNQIVISAADTTHVVVPGGTGLGVPATVNDFNGGTLYFVERDTHVNVTATAVSASGGAGNNYTFTFTPPLSSAAVAGETVRAIPFAVGGKPSFNATTPHQSLSVAVADKAGGGQFIVTKVDLKRYRVRGRFAAAP
jgi:hypothetical protein